MTLGPVRLDHLALALGAADHSLSARVSARVAVSLGPIAVMLDQLGGAVTLDRSVDGALGLGALSASAVLRLAADPDGLARDLARPMPRAPKAAATRGTRFHAFLALYSEPDQGAGKRCTTRC